MPSTTLLFGELSSPSVKHSTLSPKTWTCVGALAIPLWATWPSLAIQTLVIPPFESLAVMFLFGCAVLTCLRRSDGVDMAESSVKRSWLPAGGDGVPLGDREPGATPATHRVRRP